MEHDEFKRLFRNALEYFHGKEMDDDELDEVTEQVVQDINLDAVNRKWYTTPNYLARMSGTAYLEQRAKNNRK